MDTVKDQVRQAGIEYICNQAAEEMERLQADLREANTALEAINDVAEENAAELSDLDCEEGYHGLLKALIDDWLRIKADLRKAEWLLREVEWRGVGESHWEPTCPSCEGTKPNHEDGCKLKAWLERQ